MSHANSLSNSSLSPSTPEKEDTEDPLHISENERLQSKLSGIELENKNKRKFNAHQNESDDDSIKKLKTDDNQTNKNPLLENSGNGGGDNSGDSDNKMLKTFQEKSPENGDLKVHDEVEEEQTSEEKDLIHNSSEQNCQQTQDQNHESDNKSSKECNKKNEKKVQNLRKNIKDVLDESQLDAITLAAQRQESERLARVQEQQRLIRETQRQLAAEKQANKTQQKVLSLLQGETSERQLNSSNSSSNFDLDDIILEKFSLNSNVNIMPTAKSTLQSLQSLISTDDTIPETDNDSDDDVVIQPDESQDKSKAVVVDSSSSDSDDCIILSDEEEEDVEDDDENNSGEHINDIYNQPDLEGRVVVNIGHHQNESKIFVAPQIARVIKPHQIGGVRFLFDNIIESVDLFEKSSGFGCILAHSMGLGKTLQLVCFCDIFLRHTSSKKILVIMPINTLQNWLHEFNMWLPLPEDVDKSPLKKDGEVRARNFKIFVLNDSHKTLNARAKTVIEWSQEGGVLMMGYEIYRLLSLRKMKQTRKKGIHQLSDQQPTKEDRDMFDKIYSALVNPGPDLIVCDEGHRIKNAHASTSMALKQIKSKRRIVLTGYPLQNNLLEYWCMVDFVRPSYLGTKTEFSNMFERPIQNGQCIDSTPQDCKLMRYRAHVLHSLLKGFVQRRSHQVLQKCLPEKTEFVLLFRMTPFQRKLYTVFMNEVVRSKRVPNPLKAFSVCCKIWNHPDILFNFLKKRELDLDLELEETEAIGKVEANGVGEKQKRRGRKLRTKKSQDDSNLELEKSTSLKKSEVKIEQDNGSSSNGIKSNTTNSNSSNGGNSYSSNRSTLSSGSYISSSSGNYESSSYNSSYHQNYESNYLNPYPPYNNNHNNNHRVNNDGSYQHWNSGNHWQNNYTDFSHQNYYQQPFYGNTSYQSFEHATKQQPPINNIKIENLTTDKDIEQRQPLNNETSIVGDVKPLIETKDQQQKEDFETKDSNSISNKVLRDDGIPYEWAIDLLRDYVSDLLESSPKMEVFFCILEESIKLGDRLLVFSQSLFTLNLLEKFLQRSKIPDAESNWSKNTSYFRLDGSTTALEREKLINEFNANTKVKLFLVSTRAGSLGINLVGANRVVVFDASWNPCHDTQAVCRVYRYGQAKSCYVYRFVMDNCLEKKIYDRQINKQGMADRVVDECNPDAHLRMSEVTSLCYDDGEDPDPKEFKEEVDKYKDVVMKIVLTHQSKALTKEPFQHESLLVDRKEKKLSQAEKRLAQRGYEMEKQAATKPSFNYNPSIGSNNYRAYRTPDGSLIHRPIASVRPMQSELGDALNSAVRANNNQKPNRWVPVEVWQSKGLTAQEMTLPQDVSIQTNSADKSKIYLKAGQKVIVLKSPKGICLQLESGKVIAIRASIKTGQPTGQVANPDQKLCSFSGMQDPSHRHPNRAKFTSPTKNDGDVIDISNDDDDESQVPAIIPNKDNSLLPIQSSNAIISATNDTSVRDMTEPSRVDHTTDTMYKEKVVYKPNLVQRRPKFFPTQTTSSHDTMNLPTSLPKKNLLESGYQGHLQPSFTTIGTHSSSNYYNQNVNGAPKLPTPVPKLTDNLRKTSINHQARDKDKSLPPFYSPNVRSFMTPPPPIPSQNMYQQPPYPSTCYNSPSAAPNNNCDPYPYNHPSFLNTPPQNFHYPTPGSGNYDPGYLHYQGYNYNNLPPPHSYPPSIDSDSNVQVPFSSSTTGSTYNDWNYNI